MSKTLVLNADFRPMASNSTCSSRDAVVHCFYGKTTAVEYFEPARFLHTPSLELQVPSVIALREYAPFQAPVGRADGKLSSRRSIILRDGGECVYCRSRGIENRSDLTIDHVYPKSRWTPRDGVDVNGWENKVACCKTCNQIKGDQTLEEIGWTLDRVPSKPDTSSILKGYVSEEIWTRWVLPTLAQ